jgi:hypothetical protein
MKRISVLLATLLVAGVVVAEPRTYPKAMVSFEDFKGLVAEVETHRAARLIDLDTFLRMSGEPGVVILDTRSTDRYERIHVKGARHLSFTDFTQDNLQQTIPSVDTPILIYCNNNFEGNQTDFASKAFMPRPGYALAREFGAEARPMTMALNVPTYINLYGYGYRNIHELDELVNVTDPRIAFEGSIVTQNTESLLPRIPID